jgi:hypothetical protein
VFHLDVDASTVTWGGAPLPSPVHDAAEHQHRDAPTRHTFTAQLPHGLYVRVAWNPDDHSGRVWVEDSYDPSQPFWLDRPGVWQGYATRRSTPPEYAHTRYLPRLVAAGDAHQALVDGHSVPFPQPADT